MKNVKEQFTAVYIRTSTYDQVKGADSQRRALKRYCRLNRLSPLRWYKDTVSGAADKRPALDKLQRRVFEGRVDCIVVWSLDRVSRKGIADGMNILQGWFQKKIRVVSVSEQLDFTGPFGELAAALIFALAKMYRVNLIENTRRGLHAARQRGSRLGRPPKVQAQELVAKLRGGMAVSDAADELGCTPQAIYSSLRRAGMSLGEVRRVSCGS